MTSPTWLEDHVEADGFRIRYAEAGEGSPLVHLHGGGGLTLTPAHELLARERRVIAFEMPGFGDSPENTRHQAMPDLARTMLEAVSALGIEELDLMGTSFGGKVALWAALIAPPRIRALVLESPAAIRPDGARPPEPATPEELVAMLHAHPERVPPRPPSSLDQRARTRPLLARLIGPSRDPELEEAMRGLEVPVLVVFGTEDRLTPPELGRIYKELLPHAHLLFVYDAGHATAADRPEAFAEAVADFLARREQFVVSARSSVLFP
ncbi:MAG: alpha/beta hydrolase [Chloroflexi bacterium]|nr:MAG: alpha/beta hydrolase [Chloroflexota bacterium]